METKKNFSEDWKVLSRFFTAGWKTQAIQSGAFNRVRGVKSINVLLRLLLIHLADGCSLRETVTRSKEGGLADISDVALLGRLKKSSDWFRWMAEELLRRKGINPCSNIY
jgi:hypothetical protein